MYTKISETLFLSSGTRLSESEENIIYFPSPEIEGLREPGLPWLPSVVLDTNVNSPVNRSQTNIWVHASTDLQQVQNREVNAIKRPSADIEGLTEPRLP